MLGTNNDTTFTQRYLSGASMMVPNILKWHCHNANKTLPKCCLNVGPQRWGATLANVVTMSQQCWDFGQNAILVQRSHYVGC